MMTLRDVTNENLKAMIDLYNTLTVKEQHAVTPNEISLAQAYVNLKTAWPKAIYLNHEVIGFLMLSLKESQRPKEDQPCYYLWRLMISNPYQNQGYGKQVLDLLVQKCKKDQQRYLFVSVEPQEVMPLAFYLRYGFETTHLIEEEELLLKLKIS
jgi:diamine N-acetyltransferase